MRKVQRFKDELGSYRVAELAQAQVTEGGWYDGRSWLTAKEIAAAEERWAKRSYATGVYEGKGAMQWIAHQCGGCKFFAALGNDYGICWNKKSPHDGAITFEHGGCGEHSGFQENPL